MRLADRSLKYHYNETESFMVKSKELNIIFVTTREQYLYQLYRLSDMDEYEYIDDGDIETDKIFFWGELFGVIKENHSGYNYATLVVIYKPTASKNVEGKLPVSMLLEWLGLSDVR